MIKQITKLKNLGIFSDFKSTEATLREFKRFNLIYGWNGSGKSTLTKLFASLEKRKLHSDFSTCDFNISILNENPITHNNIHDSQLNIRVFNQDFVNDNIQWENDKTAKSILILSEGKIEEKRKFEKLQEQIASKTNEQKIKENDSIAKTNVKDSFLSSTAKAIKEAFKIIDTSDTHYFNYNRTKLDLFIISNKDKLKTTQAILSKDELENLTVSIKPNSKPELLFDLKELNAELLLSAETRLKDIIQSNIVNESIPRLKENSDIQSWVEAGIVIHEQHQSDSCEYCGQNLPQNRSKELKNHFNDQYKIFIDKIEQAINWITDQKLNIVDLPDASSIYEEFQTEFLTNKNLYAEKTINVNNIIQDWINILEEKRQNPFLDFKWRSNSISDPINQLNEKIQALNNTKNSHNQKTRSFNSILQKQKTKLEMHYAADAIKEAKHFELISSITTVENEIKSHKQEIVKLKEEAFEIEKELSDEIKGAAEFNELLSNFLGRDDISLEFNKKEGGYKLLRKGTDTRAKNLSEGEKTAIAFIYFILKLRENGNKISETIVIIDDPVSSLDSNHLIHSYSFLKNQCQDVKQLFVLTHNFNFFKLIRDWMYYIKPTEGDKNYYTLNADTNDGKRESIIANANNFLLKYNSEYHYLFFKLNEYNSKVEINMDDMYIIANIARRFIESLITFKYPKKEKDLWLKFKKVQFDEVLKTKVYKFINLFSHNDKIESHETFGDNLFGEGKALVQTTLDFIRAVDEPHYEELVAISNN